ncbi:immunoglobulin superfamily member 11 [Genypterus blacodes]|uniref:immunoglobulin superfamily member 11 n=1 Tax=Genypterus blacodes TaxID=154954 RepID=UPI003F75FE7A
MMGPSGSWILWTLCVCLTPRQNVALRVNMRDSSLEVVQGDSVVLPCSFFTSSPLSRLNIVWTLAPVSSPDSPMQVIVYDHGQVIEEPSLIGRVSFAGIPWSADVILNDTRVSDAGVYHCMVNNPPETSDTSVGELQLSVTAPPSLPVCEWFGDVSVGGSVSLSCSVSEGVPTPELHWDHLEEEEVSLPVHMEDDLSGSVQIFNVSAQTSGLYRCSASNLLGSQSCYVNLSVYSASQSSSGVLEAVTLTLSMVLLMLALVLLLRWLHRTGHDGKGKEEEEEEERYNEIQYTPTVVKRSFV